MAEQWFMMRDDKKYGPYSSAQLKQMASTGGVLPLDMVQKEGGKWLPATQIKGLFPATPPASPPPMSGSRGVDAPPPLATRGPPPPPAEASNVVVLTPPNRRAGPGPERVTGLMPPLVGMMVVVGLALLMGLYGFLPVFTDDLREPTRNGILLALTLLQNAFAMFGLAQTLTASRRYGFAVLGSLLALTSWGWLLFTTAPIAVTLLGTLAGLGVGFWGLMVLKNPEVRAQFKDNWMPAESLWQRHSAPVISGTVGGGMLAAMLLFGLLLWLTTGEKRSGDYSRPGQPGPRDPRDVGPDREVRPDREIRPDREVRPERKVRPPREIRNRTGGSPDE